MISEVDPGIGWLSSEVTLAAGASADVILNRDLWHPPCRAVALYVHAPALLVREVQIGRDLYLTNPVSTRVLSAVAHPRLLPVATFPARARIDPTIWITVRLENRETFTQRAEVLLRVSKDGGLPRE